MQDRRLPPGPWWFAGARRTVLRKCPTECAFYNALGLMVLLVAAMDGLSAESAVADATHTAFFDLWFVGAMWAFVIASVDRVLLMQTTTKRGLLGLALRSVVAMAAAVLFAVVAMLFVFRPEISYQLQHTNQLAVQEARTQGTDYYQPRIAADQRQITAMETKQQSLQQEITTNEFLMNCEAGQTDCSTTHQLGEGPYYFHYKSLAAIETVALKALEAQDKPRIAQLNQNIATLEHQEQQAITAVSSAAHNDSGLIARLVALGEISKGHPLIVRGLMVILGLIFVCVALIPIFVKLKHIWSGESPYEQLLTAERRNEATGAYQRNQETDVEKDRIADQGLADREVNKARIHFDTERKLADMEAGFPAGGGYENARARSSSDYVQGYSLDQMLSKVETHGKRAVDVPTVLRRGALIGVALIAALAAAVFLLTLLAHVAIAGLWLVLVLAVLAGALAIFTRGFLRAPRWALRAVFAVLLAGLVLPILVILMNV